MTETQQRFLKEIADRVNGGRVAELRLYPTVRVGQVESGVAIVATAADRVQETVAAAADGAGEIISPAEQIAAEVVEVADAVTVPDDAVEGAAAVPGPERLSILTAHFRHTVKGPDRGKWEFSLVHDADAPIEIVESVVRGVARRAGEDGEPELLSGDDFQRALTEPWWNATT
jgi:hypothetical protein